MSRLTRVGDIDVPQDLAYERRSYRLRQVAAVAFALVLLAALLGVLGRSGPLSDTSASAGGALRLDYERFLRLDAPTELEIRIGSGSGATEVALAQDFLEDFHVRGYSVEPESAKVESDRVVYTFEQEAPSQVTLVVAPQEIGRHTGTLYGPDGSELSFDQWVWP